MTASGGEIPAIAAAVPAESKRGRGRPRQHGLPAMRRTLGKLTTRRLDGRSAVAVAVRAWKADVRRDLGDDLTRAQEALLEAAAQSWVILSSLDDYIGRQPSLVSRKRQVLPVVMQRMQVAEALARQLERLGLSRRAQEVADLGTYLAQRRGTGITVKGKRPTPSTHPRASG